MSTDKRSYEGDAATVGIDDGGVATLQLRQPALDPRMTRELDEAASFVESSRVRSLLIVGGPRVFCIGGDLGMVAGLERTAPRQARWCLNSTVGWNNGVGWPGQCRSRPSERSRAQRGGLPLPPHRHRGRIARFFGRNVMDLTTKSIHDGFMTTTQTARESGTHPNDTIEPFVIRVPEADLDDLRERLARTRWPEGETVGDTSQGPPLEKLQALLAYWSDGYDWRRCEALLNGLGQFRTTIDGLGIHFLHIRSAEPDALPLLLTHGWPGSVLEFHDVIGPLTDPVRYGGDASDAFHLVIPTLPGFGFSDKPDSTGWGVSRIADAWIELMDRLGYDTWAAQGGDWGSAVTEAIGRKAPAGLVGLHFNMALVYPTAEEVAEATPQERAMIDGAQHYEAVLSAFYKQQTTRPQTIGYSLSDSPAGLAAWIYACFQDFSDSNGDPESIFSLDAMLDDIMLYWLTNSAASSARLYWETAQQAASQPYPTGPNPTPAGFSIFPVEAVRASRRWIEKRYATVLHVNELEHGGHFAAWEQPAVFAEELRATFRTVR